MENKYTMETVKETINQLLKRYPEEITEDKRGNTLIKNLPKFSQYCFLHTLYRPLDDKEYVWLQEQYSLTLPPELTKFYRIINGLHLFTDHFSISGVQRGEGEDVFDLRDPYDLRVTDIGRPKHCPEQWLFFGGYSGDSQKKVFFDLSEETANGKHPIYCCYIDSKENGTLTNRWDSFEEWFVTEVNRLLETFPVERIDIIDDLDSSPPPAFEKKVK